MQSNTLPIYLSFSEVRSIVDLQLSIIQEDTLLITELENMLRQSPGQQAVT